MVDYYCFTASDLEEYDDMYNASANAYLNATDEQDIAFAKSIGKALFLDINDGCIYYDENFTLQVPSLEGKKVLPRSCYFEPMVEAIEHLGGTSLFTKEDDKKLDTWPNLIQPQFRELKITTLKESIEEIKEQLKAKKKLFIKTVKKDISGIVSNINTFNDDMYQKVTGRTRPMYGLRISQPTYDNNLVQSVYRLEHAIREDTPIMYSDTIDICQEQGGARRPLEYRGFVVNGKMDDMSLKHGDKITIPNNVVDKAEQLIATMKGEDFPESYVIDIFKHLHDGEQVLDLGEFNNISMSVRGAGNSLFTNETCPRSPSHTM